MPDRKKELDLQIQYALVERLSASEARYLSILNLVQDVVFEVDAGQRFIYLNSAWEKLLGYGVQDGLGRGLADFLSTPKLDGPKVASAFAADAGQEVLATEISLRTAQGLDRLFTLRVSGSGSTRTGTLLDVTEERQAELQLRLSQAETHKLSLLASTTTNLVVITDAAGRMEWVNKSFETTTGYSLEDATGRTPGELLQGPETSQDAIDTMREAVRAGEPFSVETINYSHSGHSYWVQIDCQPVFDPDGMLVNFVAIESDISERKASEQRVRESERRLRYVVDNISEVILRTDAEHNLTYLNPAWKLLSGFRPEDNVGQPLSTLATEDPESVLRALHESAAGTTPIEPLEFQCHTADGIGRWVELQLTPVYDDRDLYTGAAGVLIDIDAQRARAIALERAKNTAESLLQDKARFIANMSHELRTPLNAVVGMTDLLADSGLTHDQEELVDAIRSGGQQLQSLVSNILDFSQLDNDNFTLTHEIYDPGRVCGQALEVFCRPAAKKGLSLILDVHPDVPNRIIGDVSRITQLLANLVDNAIKFTAAGEVHVELRRAPAQISEQLSLAPGGNTSTEVVTLQLVVSDTGIGIHAEHLDNICSAFTQVDSSITRQFGGTGLGLAFCEKILAAAGGRLDITSDPGAGSVFTASCPMRIATAEPTPHQTGEVQICVAPEAADSRLCRAVEHAVAGNGWRPVIRPATTIKARTNGPIVLVDPAPGMDLRELASPGHNLVAVFPQGARNTTASTCNHSIEGCFLPHHLLDMLAGNPGTQPQIDATDTVAPNQRQARGAATTKTGPGPGPGPESATGPSLRVLVAEDQEVNQRVLDIMLTGLGHQVEIAANGVQAVSMAKERTFDVVLMDLQMPAQDGFAATRAIRSDPTIQPQPHIIAVTADSLSEGRAWCLAAGMDNFLTKPLVKATLAQALMMAAAHHHQHLPTAATSDRMPLPLDNPLMAAVGRQMFLHLIDQLAAKTTDGFAHVAELNRLAALLDLRNGPVPLRLPLDAAERTPAMLSAARAQLTS